MPVETAKNKVPFYQTWMTIVYNSDLQIIEIINPQHCMLLSHPADSILGLNPEELEQITEGPNKESAHIIAKNVRRAMAQNRNVYFEYATAHNDGTTTYAVCYAEKAPDGNLYFNVIKIDEENIFEARAGFTNYVINTTMNNISVGVYMRHISDKGKKKYILFNDVVKSLYESDDIQSSEHWNQADEDLADEKALELRDPIKIEKVLRDSDGNIKRWLVVTKKKINSRASGMYVITTVIDITKRRENEILIEKQFALLDSMYEHLPEGILIYSRDGKLITYNKKIVDLLGVEDAKSVLKRNVFDEPYVPEDIKQKLRAGQNSEYEITYDFSKTENLDLLNVQKGRRILAIKAVVVRNSKGEIDGYLQICEDITDKRTTERALQEKHKLIDTIYNTIPMGIELYDKKGTLLEFNDYNTQLMGFKDKSEIVGINLYDDPNIPEDVKEGIRKGNNIDITQEYNYELAKQDFYDSTNEGSKFLNIKSAVIHNEADEISGHLLVYQDRTQDVNRERLLEETLAKFSSMFSSMMNGVEYYSADGKLLDCNNADLRIFGIDKKEEFLSGKVNIFDNPNVKKEDLLKVKKGEVLRLKILYDFDKVKHHNYFSSTKRGKIALDVIVSPIITDDNEHLGYTVEIEDITERVANDRKLKESLTKFSSMFSSMTNGVEIYDKDGILIDCNDADMKIFGVANKSNFVNGNVALFNNPNIKKVDVEKLLRGEMVTLSMTYDFDVVKERDYYITQKRGKIHLDINVAPMIVGENDFIGYIVEMNDVTEKVNRERLYEETAIKLSAMFNSMTNGVEIYNKDGVMIDCNDADIKIFGIEHKEDLINSAISIYDNPNVPYESLSSLLKGESLSVKIEYDFETIKATKYFPTSKSGKIFIQVKFSAMYDNNNEFMGYVAEIDDITDITLKDIELKNTQRELSLAMEAGKISAWNYDVKSNSFVVLNNNELSGKSISWNQILNVVCQEDYELISTTFNAIKSGEKDNAKIVLRDSEEGENQHYFEVNMIASNVGGEVISILGTQKDITDDVLLKKELEDSYRQVSLITDNLISGMVYISTDYTVVWKKLSPLRNLARAEKYEVGKKCYENVFGRTSPCEKCVIKKVVEAQGRSMITQIEDDGTVFNITGDRVRDKQGSTLGYICRLDDVTSEYNHKKEIEQGRKNLSLALDAGNVAAWIYNVDTKMFNTLQGDAIAGKGVTMEENQKMIHPDDCQRQIDILDSVIRGKQERAETVFRYIHSDGKYHHYESKMIAKRDRNGKLIGITGTQKDITDQIEYQQQLVSLKEEAVTANKILNQILDNIPGVLYVKNASDNYRFVLVNQGLCDYVGRPYDQVVGHFDSEMFEVNNSEKFNYYDKLVAETGKSYSYDECVTLNGDSTYWRIYKSPLKMQNGDIYTVGIAVDISETMNANKNLQLARKQAETNSQILNEIIDCVPGAMYIKDTSEEFKYIKVNEAFCQVVGKTKYQILGHNDYEVFDIDSANKFREYDLRLISGTNTVSYDNVVDVNGRKAYWTVSKSRITTQDNNSIILGVASNITELYLINQELEKARQAAELSDKLKSAFLANMSHEIRTPLNAIVGFSELLLSTDDKEEGKEYSNIINTNSDLLLRLVGDILDLSKIESGLIDLRATDVDVSVAFNETFASLKNHFKNPEVELKGINPYKKCVVNIDKNRMLQIGTNFATNAMKYTKSGEIVIGYEYIDGGLQIYVKDTGIGVKKEKQPMLFKRFAKLDDFAQGTGLGLAICKAIVDANGGKIGYESEEGVGSTFWAWLPCELKEMEQ
ncbi:MAG: PAS domain S-box protein [Muribaculaceae bacterium]|nr:PAS domain S-box protein [Muribaculaceae bacterium]